MQDMSEQLKVYASPAPFSNKQTKHFAAPGSSVAQIVAQILPDHLERAGIGAIAMIGDTVIPRENWHLVKPKLGATINVRVVPGKGGGKKNPLATILSIAVMIAAPYVGAALANVAGFGGLWVGSTFFSSAQIYGAAFSIVGKMAISALAPPPKPSNAGIGNISNPTSSPTQFIEGANNSLNPFGVIPICLGTNRMFPLQAARPYTETQNNDQYVRQLFTYGYGKVQITDRRFGENPITEFDELEINDRLEGDLHEGTGLYPDDVFQDDYNVLLQQVDGYTTRQTRPDASEALVDFTFPRGFAQFTQSGLRGLAYVKLDMSYRKVGSSGDWSAGSEGFKVVGATSFTADVVTGGGESPWAAPDQYRRDVIVVDIDSGVQSLIKGTVSSSTADGALAAPLPANALRIGTALIKPNRPTNGSPATTTIVSVIDDRQAAWYGNELQDNTSYVPYISGGLIHVSGGQIKTNVLDLQGGQTEAMRFTRRIVFPEPGQYDVRFRRITGDTNSDQLFDKVYLTAIRSVAYRSPVRKTGLSGSAMRIRGTDQLNGAVDTYNVVVSAIIPDYDVATGTWIERATSNPASIYRWVLQGPANARPLADSKIDIAALEDWHIHCADQNYTYNRVIDYETSVAEVLRDVASAGAASPAIVDGKRTIVIDRIKDDIVQIFTPRNTWEYKGELVYTDMPHAFLTKFRNKDKGYAQDERIVYDDGYDENNATKFEGLELQSCTNSDLAFKTARRHIATARLQPETHSFMTDVENLVALRGDRVLLEHDVPLIGVGDGRIKEVYVSGGAVTGFLLDDTVSIPDTGRYYFRLRLHDGTLLYREIVTAVGETKTFNFVTPWTRANDEDGQPLFQPGDLGYVVKTGEELDVIITRIEPQDDLTARITCVNYAPERFDAENSTIPAWESNITTPIEFQRPLPPVLLDIQSDESLIIVQPDGSYIARAVITLNNRNGPGVSAQVKIRPTGATSFSNANVLEASPERIILTGLEDGKTYDIHVRYLREGTTTLSLPLQLNNYKIVGSSGLPSDVTNFIVDIAGQNALFKWDESPDFDHAFWRMKFTGVFTGATWETAQLKEDRIYENRISLPFQPGTYLIKAVDRLGNESENATAIITYDPGNIQNNVEVLQEDPTFPGFKDNVYYSPSSESIVLADVTLGDGYYYFDETFDLGGVYTSTLSPVIVAGGDYINNFFTFDDVFAVPDVFAGGDDDFFAETDVFAIDDVFGIGTMGWAVQLQYRTTNDNPSGSPTWSDWAEVRPGNVSFRAIQFRILLRSTAQNITPRVSVARVTIDMEDRIERGEDITVPATGVTIIYDVPFKESPAVTITIQDGDAADEIEYINKDEEGFEFMVYNRVDMAYVERSFDFISSGFGRKI